MNRRFWRVVLFRLTLCFCLLLLVSGQPSTGAAAASSRAGIPLIQPGAPGAAEAPTFTAIDAGDAYTCALTSNGGARCWGWNGYGQLGDGTNTQHGAPVDVAGLASGVTAIAAGVLHTCALVLGGGVKCWGRNDYGQLGDGTYNDNNTPVNVVGLESGVIAIAPGWGHTCALTSGGGVKCWGYNLYGQLGDGTNNSSNTPVDVAGLASGVIAITAGDWHTCAIVAGGGATCWGWNHVGQLGNGTNNSSNMPVDVVGLASGVTAIDADGHHTCALGSGGGVQCWGGNDYGQLGDGTTDDHNTPVDVAGLSNDVTAIATGSASTCALVSGGGARCWGANWSGQLGDGTTTRRSIPVDVVGLDSGVTTITAGGSHTCALISGDGIQCWGLNASGQLGDGTTTYRSIPVDVVGLDSSITTITAGMGHTCVLTSSGGAKCWGDNEFGQVGDGTRTLHGAPVDVFGMTGGVTAIASGGMHTCALVSGGGARCWGDNEFGELGDGTYYNRNTPVDVAGLSSGVTIIAAGVSYTCALVSGGGVKCWGDNEFGQVGDGSWTDRSTPVDVAGLTEGVTAIATGGDHACALVSGGGVKCWGKNSGGQLGDGTATDRGAPVNVVGLASGVIAIDAGGGHTCAIVSDGGVKCWGDNGHGQLGDGTLVNHNTPVDAIGLASDVTAISAGGSHTCALVSGGEVKCWGRNDYGQLGDGTWTDRSMPADVAGLERNVTVIATGVLHTCALVGAGRSKCWGYDGYGQLGLGMIGQRLTPVDVVESAPSLTINYPNGQPGSFLTLTGWNYPPDAQATLTINGQVLTTSLTVNPTGSFIFFLDSSDAEQGGYAVTVSVTPTGTFSSLDTDLAESSYPSAAASFFLYGDAPLRPQEGGGQTFLLTEGVALHDFVYLPLMKR